MALAAAGHFGPPVLAKDRFCVTCGLAHCSHSCPDHFDYHHHLHPGAAPDSVKTVLHIDGWAAVPEGQLPAPFVVDVQVSKGNFLLVHLATLHCMPPTGYNSMAVGFQALHLPDGSVAYPVHRRGAGAHLHHLPAAAHACLRPECPESFIGPQRFRSLRCRHQAG